MSRLTSRPPIVRISNGTFYRHHPGAASLRPNPPLFTNLNFELGESSSGAAPKHWCIIGPSLAGKTTLLQILRGQHLCLPPTARSFPYLASDTVPDRLRNPTRAIQYVGFDGERFGGGGLGPTTSAYLSARYESRRENTDFSLRDFLLGNTELNPLKKNDVGEDGVSSQLLERVVADLRLEPLLSLPVAFLSNGQGRRARIARALLTSPEVLFLDEPFMGLDPPTVAGLSPVLKSLAERENPRLVLSARPQDPLPDWITHLMYLRNDCQISSMGPKEVVLEGLRKYVHGVRKGTLQEDDKMPVHSLAEVGKTLTEGRLDTHGSVEPEAGSNSAVSGTTAEEFSADEGEAVVEMQGCQVMYGDKVALGNWTEQRGGEAVDGLVWTVRRGHRWGVFGPNGSGKTTIVSLLCSDHPQTYSLPIKLFGKSRLPEPGSGELPLTFWDIQSRIGHSSPEIHQHLPRNLTIRQVIANAWSNTFRGVPQLNEEANAKVDACLTWFAPELNPVHISGQPAPGEGAEKPELSWADDYLFGGISFSAQRVLLLLRALVKNPDVVVLDEAFSGMDDGVRDRCMLFLQYGERRTLRTGDRGTQEVVESEVAKRGEVKVTGLSDQQALICISHIKEEVPDMVREWLCLPEANSGKAARFGRLSGPLRTDQKRWAEIWGY